MDKDQSTEVTEDEYRELNKGLIKGSIGTMGAVAGVVAGIASGSPLWLFASMLSPMVAELVGAIPKRQQERWKTFLTSFRDKTADIDPEVIADKADKQEYQELFEQGLFVSARAATNERIEAISSIVANGFKGDGSAQVASLCLSIISDLDDMTLAYFLFVIEIQSRQNRVIDSDYDRDFLKKWFGMETLNNLPIGVESMLGLIREKIRSSGLAVVDQHSQPSTRKDGERVYKFTSSGAMVIRYIESEHPK